MPTMGSHTAMSLLLESSGAPSQPRYWSSAGGNLGWSCLSARLSSQGGQDCSPLGGGGRSESEVSLGQNMLEAMMEHPGEGIAPNGLHSGKMWWPEFIH